MSEGQARKAVKLLAYQPMRLSQGRPPNAEDEARSAADSEAAHTDAENETRSARPPALRMSGMGDSAMKSQLSSGRCSGSTGTARVSPLRQDLRERTMWRTPPPPPPLAPPPTATATPLSVAAVGPAPPSSAVAAAASGPAVAGPDRMRGYLRSGPGVTGFAGALDGRRRLSSTSLRGAAAVAGHVDDSGETCHTRAAATAAAATGWSRSSRVPLRPPPQQHARPPPAASDFAAPHVPLPLPRPAPGPALSLSALDVPLWQRLMAAAAGAPASLTAAGLWGDAATGASSALGVEVEARAQQAATAAPAAESSLAAAARPSRDWLAYGDATSNARPAPTAAHMPPHHPAAADAAEAALQHAFELVGAMARSLRQHAERDVLEFTAHKWG